MTASFPAVIGQLKRVVKGGVRRLNLVVNGEPAPYVDLIHAVKNEVVGEIGGVKGQMHAAEAAQQSLQDQQAMTGTRVEQVLNQQVATRDEVGFARDDVLAKLDRIARAVRLQVFDEFRLEDVEQATADVLNYVGSHRGPLADVGLWRNDPIVVEWVEGSAHVGAVNERIVEQPFVLGALAGLPAGARILDIGGGESLIGLSLASLGHDVTVLEPAGYPYRHPNLHVAEQTLESFEPGQPFDAVILLSVIEHFGIGAYANNGELDDDADIDAMRLVADLVRPGGSLVLTTPFGPAAVNELERTYDEKRLRRLLDAFEFATVAVGSRIDATTWQVTGDDLSTPPEPGHVAMVHARRPA